MSPVFRVGVCVWLTVPPMFALVLARMAMDKYWPDASRTPAWDTPEILKAQLVLAVVMPSVALALALVNLWVPFLRRRGWELTAGSLRASLLLPALVVPLVRVTLPWEDPYSGDGSPLAVLMSLVFTGFVSVFFFVWPCVLLWLREARERDLPATTSRT